MTNIAYFADLPNGETVEFRATVKRVQLNNGMTRSHVVEPRVGLMIQTYPTLGAGNTLCGYIEGKGWTKITRKVVMKSSPSRHECDTRCMFATGRTMQCECACGGKNHGRGGIACEAA
jgi:hypothetical protein